MKKENKGMKSKKKSWLVLIVVVLMIAACGYVSAYGYGKDLSLIHLPEPTRPERISYAVFCLKKKKTDKF